MSDWIIECQVPEGYYCDVHVLTEWWEFLLVMGGIGLILAIGIGLMVWAMNR